MVESRHAWYALAPTSPPASLPSCAQLVTNHPQLHAYAARKSVEALRRGASYEVCSRCSGWYVYVCCVCV